MAINPYFNVRGNKIEQNLIEDLIVESIKINGMNFFYLPRTVNNLDPILGEDPSSSFETAFEIEMYFDSPDLGDTNRFFISKFGLEMRETCSVIVSRRRFNEVIKKGNHPTLPIQYTTNEVRPMEGDLIYIPLFSHVYQINFVDHESTFWNLGKRYVWRCDLEKFAYSGETFNTGIPEIDAIQKLYDNQDSVKNDPLAENDELQKEAETIVNNTESDLFGDIV